MCTNFMCEMFKFVNILLLAVSIYIAGSQGQQSEYYNEQGIRISRQTSTKATRISQRECILERFYKENSAVKEPGKPGEFPHMAAIGWVQPRGDYDYYCGGALIKSDFVLTAAHCLALRAPPDIVLLGGLNLYDPSGANQTRTIEQVHVHPDYKRKQFYNDIALLQLSSKSDLSPACLWPFDKFEYKRATVLGYGQIEDGVRSSSNLLKADLTIFTNEVCRLYYTPGYKLAQGFVDSQICAGDFTRQRNTCPGDTGGPMQVHVTVRDKVIPLILGIASFGQACAGGPTAVYTKVSAYIDWIESIVWPSSPSDIVNLTTHIGDPELGGNSSEDPPPDVPVQLTSLDDSISELQAPDLVELTSHIGSPQLDNSAAEASTPDSLQSASQGAPALLHVATTSQASLPDEVQLTSHIGVPEMPSSISEASNPNSQGQTLQKDPKWEKLRLCAKKCYMSHVPWAVAAGEELGVAGGVKTKPGEFRHMAALGWRNQQNGYDYQCGGTLVSPIFVLTAAHCRSFKGRAPDVALIGGAPLSNLESGNKPLRITKVFVYPQYNRRRVYHDIALMKLASSSIYSQSIACLWPIPKLKYETGVVVGYGQTGYGNTGSNELLKAELQIVPNQECSRFYSPAYRLEAGIIDAQFCAGDRNKIRDTCPGDSGGPLLMYLNISNKTIPFVLGITSFGQACASGPPGVYTRVSSYLDWIESILWPTEVKH